MILSRFTVPVKSGPGETWLGELQLPEISPKGDSDPHNARDAKRIAETLGLQPTRSDLTPMLTQLGLYRLVSEQRMGDSRHHSQRRQQPSAFRR